MVFLINRDRVQFDSAFPNKPIHDNELEYRFVSETLYLLSGIKK
jgi:hypothetical protein